VTKNWSPPALAALICGSSMMPTFGKGRPLCLSPWRVGCALRCGSVDVGDVGMMSAATSVREKALETRLPRPPTTASTLCGPPKGVRGSTEWTFGHGIDTFPVWAIGLC
jgi:hypothetical protein